MIWSELGLMMPLHRSQGRLTQGKVDNKQTKNKQPQRKHSTGTGRELSRALGLPGLIVLIFCLSVSASVRRRTARGYNVTLLSSSKKSHPVSTACLCPLTEPTQLRVSCDVRSSGGRDVSGRKEDAKVLTQVARLLFSNS